MRFILRFIAITALLSPVFVEAKLPSCASLLRATSVSSKYYTEPIAAYSDVINSYHRQEKAGIKKQRIRLSTSGIIGQDIKRLYMAIANDRENIIGNYTRLVRERHAELTPSERRQYKFNANKNIVAFVKYYDGLIVELDKMLKSEDVLYYKYYNVAGGVAEMVSYKSSSGTLRQMRRMKDYVIAPFTLKSLSEMNFQLAASAFMYLPYFGPLTSVEMSEFFAHLVSPIWHPFQWQTLDGQEQSPSEAKSHDELHTDILDEGLDASLQGQTLRKRINKYKEFRDYLKGRALRTQALFQLIWFFLSHEFVDIEDESDLVANIYERVRDPKDLGAEFGEYRFTKKEIKAALEEYDKEVHPISYSDFEP
jgi:hypothetical protein